MGKTGGDTVKKHLMHRARKEGWSFFDLYMPQEPAELHRPYRWEQSKATLSLLKALNHSRPRAIVHQHSGYSGVGEYLLERWFRPLACRFRREQQLGEATCRVVLTTTLREPAARVVSHAFQTGAYGLHPETDSDAGFEAFARQQANFQTKYHLFGSDWRMREMTVGNASFDAAFLQPALACLSFFDIVGRTEALGSFRDRVDELMGWQRMDAAVQGLHNSSSSRRTLPTAEVWSIARQHTTVDALLYRSFCRDAAAASSGGPRRVQHLCEGDAPRFPHYWVKPVCAASHLGACVINRTMVRLRDLGRQPTAHDERLFEWTLVHDGRACRAGNAEAASGPEAWVVCEDWRRSDEVGSPASSTLSPYRRRHQGTDPHRMAHGHVDGLTVAIHRSP